MILSRELLERWGQELLRHIDNLTGIPCNIDNFGRYTERRENEPGKLAGGLSSRRTGLLGCEILERLNVQTALLISREFSKALVSGREFCNPALNGFKHLRIGLKILGVVKNQALNVAYTERLRSDAPALCHEAFEFKVVHLSKVIDKWRLLFCIRWCMC